MRKKRKNWAIDKSIVVSNINIESSRINDDWKKITKNSFLIANFHWLIDWLINIFHLFVNIHKQGYWSHAFSKKTKIQFNFYLLHTHPDTPRRNFNLSVHNSCLLMKMMIYGCSTFRHSHIHHHHHQFFKFAIH